MVASATALGQIEPHEAGLASGIVSTFHELGVAVVSSVAAASIAGASPTGFTQGFMTGAVVAVVAFFLTPSPKSPEPGP